MWLATLVISVTLLAVGTHACLDPYDLVNNLQLKPQYVEDALKALDVTNDNLITIEDMDIHYYHSKAQFAKEKFLKMADKTYSNGKAADYKELFNFMKDKPVKLAVFQCSYLRSSTQRVFCMKDKLLYYVYLVLDTDTIDKFFSSLASNADFDKPICMEEVEKLKYLNEAFGDKAQGNFMVEVGKDDSRIIKPDFLEYVQQQDLQDGFRTCRRHVVDGKTHFDVTCLKRSLMGYTMNKMTELDIATLFERLDDTSKQYIMAFNVMDFTKCSADTAKRFVTLMDYDRDSKISYGEFRKYVKSHSVKLKLERECPRKTDDIVLAIQCYQKKLMVLVEENHTPIWLTLSDLDLLFAFEELDFDRDGKISKREDLLRGKKWNSKLAEKLFQDLDQQAAQNGINLEEFHEYFGYPNMVYAMAKCLDLERGICRVDCFITELKDIVKDMMPQKDVDSFFNYYDTDKNGYLSEDEILNRGANPDQAGYFIRELGMGEKKVTKREFDWFVRQQEINHMFGFSDANTLEKRHEILLGYLSDIMTEYNIQSLFKKLDKENDHEITPSDFLDDIEKITRLIRKIDRNEDDKVNFVEFWLYLNTPVNNIRKRSLETKCTSQHSIENEEMDCYTKEIFNLH